jgi:hypothetical protein
VANLIGVPVAEQELTDVVASHIPALLPAKPGYARIALTEPQLGTGIPDLLVVSASMSNLSRRRRSNLRLNMPSEAAALAAYRKGQPEALTSRDRELLRSLRRRGWTEDELIRDPSIESATVIEVKVRDWKSGLHQLDRYRPYSSRRVLAVPRAVATRIPKNYLEASRIGVLVVENGATKWARRGRTQPVSTAGRLWLAELCIRAVLD